MTPAQWRGTSRPRDRPASSAFLDSWFVFVCPPEDRTPEQGARAPRPARSALPQPELRRRARPQLPKAPSCPHTAVANHKRIVIHRSSAGRLFRLFITKGEAERRGVFRPKWRFAFSLLLPRLFRGGSKEVCLGDSGESWKARRTRSRNGSVSQTLVFPDTNDPIARVPATGQGCADVRLTP